ncbi:MAG: recombination mediator RecR [Firmicutes bacterium]|nr:recombination mediator RecR [Bacillota bacterium]
MVPEPLSELIDELTKLPGIGPKTAQRLAFYILQIPEQEVKSLADALLSARQSLRQCSICYALTDCNPCEICQNEKRDSSLVCIVADPKDMMAIERTGEYHGLFHVLGGLISPLDGIGPDQLKIRELLLRLQNGAVKEIILATNPSAVGEATALYLAKLIKPLEIKITRLAMGLPMGADLEYADDITLIKALEGRREV